MQRGASERTTGVDSEHFRFVVGHLASGVTVVTTRAGDRSHGMTASSVTSLSADPPLMLVCINNALPTADAVSESGTYTVNVLAEGQGELARQFSVPGRDKFRGVAVGTGEHGQLVLRDALAHIECEVVEKVVGGTHSIFIGRVLSAHARGGHPLTYFRGGFGRFAFERDDAAYRAARHQVLARAFPVDEPISLEDLAVSLRVEETSAFYALTRLAAEGLVYRDPDRGYVVAPFDVRTSEETFDARLAIELGVIWSCLDQITVEQTRELRARFDTMADLLVGDRFVDFDAYLEANYEFHGAIVALAQNPLLTATYGALSIKSVMTRSFGSTPVTSQRFIEAQRRLLEACERRSAPAAAVAATDYCRIAKERVREILAHTGGQL
jgi:flavin reductase (DIM6/NTAB) family NADH-FMN oxidoreductase RutF/DNA-binding GntR family transcriptional regulator